jgi:hypothetical protein
LSSASFAEHEQNELATARFIAKEKEKLSVDKILIFNGCILLLNTEYNELQVHQKDQDKKIQLINTESPEFR